MNRACGTVCDYDASARLHYNYFRDYDPEIGRYIQSDPIGLAGGINTYGYVGGNPVNHTDKFGLIGDGDIYYGQPQWVQDELRRQRNLCSSFSYSYGTYGGGTAVTPAGGVVLGANGQFFSDGSSDAYAVAGVGWGWDVGGGAEANFAVHAGSGGASTWGGRFDTVTVSAFGGTGSIFWGGGWVGVSGGASSDGFAASYLITEYTPIGGDSSNPESCDCQ